jgi:hypothetical protein
LTLLWACRPATPSPSEALEGPARSRDASAARAKNAAEDEQEERQDRAAIDAGISSRALSCAADTDCLTHRCDVAIKRCRFPCRDDSDCNAGAKCATDAGRLAACFNVASP